jgi:uncharacterized metal-binding protein
MYFVSSSHDVRVAGCGVVLAELLVKSVESVNICCKLCEISFRDENVCFNTIFLMSSALCNTMVHQHLLFMTGDTAL